MGGGPRTFPGGVTKWQWKRLQAKKRSQSEERRLIREKELYQMRKRAEFLAAHPELQQPWEKLVAFPSLCTTPVQQISSLIRRFQRPEAAEDLWDHKDGPQRPSEEKIVPTCSSSCTATEEVSPTDSDLSESKAMKKKKKEVSSIGKSMQDYLDSFETDPLGLGLQRDIASKPKHGKKK